MIKYISVNPFDMHGNPTTVEIRPGYQMQKTAKYDTLMQDMRDFISNIKPQEGKAFLLIAAMGDQNWGSNRNADFWPTEALSHEGHDYGYLTFEDNGHWYHQHNNKDPEISFGKVIKSVYNPQMCRIELIVEVDLDKDHIIRDKLDNNEIIEVSMGARVSIDICKVCHPNWLEFYKIPEDDMKNLSLAKTLDEVYTIGNNNGVDLSYVTELNPDGGPVGIHSTTSKYCDHMKFNRNKLLPSGERVCVVNLRPKFFDISWVNTNADKSAFVLDKVANHVEEADDKELYKRLMQNESVALLKTASSNKTAANDKRAAIDKDVPGEVLSGDDEQIKEYYASKIIPDIVPHEKDIPDNIIDNMGSKYSLGEILSTFLAMGMYPHPREFQRIILIQSNNANALSSLDNIDNVLTPAVLEAARSEMHEMPEYDFGFSPNNISPGIAQMLAQFMPQRSWHKPYIARRIVMIKKAEHKRVNSYMDVNRKPPKVLPALLLASGMLYLASKTTGNKHLDEIMQGISQNKVPIVLTALGAAAAMNAYGANRKELQNNAAYNAFMEAEKQRRWDERMYKQSSVGYQTATIGGPILGAYLLAGGVQNKMMRGEEPSIGEQIVGKYPLAVGATGAAVLNKSTRTAIIDTLKGGGTKATEGATKIPFRKAIKPLITMSAPILATHHIAANTYNKAKEGRPYNKAEEFIAKHPLGTGLTAGALLTRPVRDAIVDLGKYIIKGASEIMSDITVLPADMQDKYICAYWEYADKENNA